jgi:hypothetical protein
VHWHEILIVQAGQAAHLLQYFNTAQLPHEAVKSKTGEVEKAGVQPLPTALNHSQPPTLNRMFRGQRGDKA